MGIFKAVRWAGFLGVLSAVAVLFAQDVPDSAEPVYIRIWLGVESISEPLPAFGDQKNISGKTFGLKELLDFAHINIDNLRPGRGTVLKYCDRTELLWKPVETDANSVLCIQSQSAKAPRIAYLATYIEVPRWIKTKLEIETPHMVKAYLDGAVVVSKTTADKAPTDKSGEAKSSDTAVSSGDTLSVGDKSDNKQDDKQPENSRLDSNGPEDEESDDNKTEDTGGSSDKAVAVVQGRVSGEIKLTPGKHLLFLKVLSDPGCEKPWTLRAGLGMGKYFGAEDIRVGIEPRRYLAIKDFFDATNVSSVSISPDGRFVAAGLWRHLEQGKVRDSWLQIYRTRDLSLYSTWRGQGSISDVKWAPVGAKLSYKTIKDRVTTLWIADLETRETTAVLEGIKEMGGYRWSADGRFIVYSLTEKFKPDKSGVKRFEGMEDRQPDWRNRSFLCLVNVPEGSCRRLTAGQETTELNDISPDGSSVIFTRSRPDYTKRPYRKTEFVLLGLSDLSARQLFSCDGEASAQFSPDGTKLLVLGSPAIFGGIGQAVPEGTIPNDYDIQAYIYDIQSGKAEAITRQFNPSIGQALWNRSDGFIYFNTTDGSYGRIYRYDVRSGQFQPINTGVDVVSEFDIARNKGVAVYKGTSATVPGMVYLLDIAQGCPQVLLDTTGERFSTVAQATAKEWSFNNKKNIQIEGTVYYPPDFDAAKKYPCIVYYYGGTTPTKRAFGGSYSANLFAAMGYVVYVLQPSGAIGYGQEFSAVHVNDWGNVVADEIITGVKQFLAAHPFVDPKRVGCIGASYGGFMTMLLQTKTDIFAAAISHAGISSISSYWGEGFWGYDYCGVSAAESFPWSRKDIFVEQSPLFHADRIKTPLLLLHGGADTNVPPGESIQLFTALKLLGREVEMVQFEGENHGIVDYKKKLRWTETILAWFDRYLKNQPQWWQELYENKD